MGIRWQDGYSSEVRLFLVIDGERIPLSHVSDRNIMLRNRREIPSGTEAEIVIVVDGQEETHRVFLPNGAIENEDMLSYF